MELRARTRVRWLLAALVVLCLPAAPGFAQTARPIFHLARFEYVVEPFNCEDPANPVLKLIKSARGDPAELQANLARLFPTDECAQRVSAEIMLATNVVAYLSSQGVGIILHLDKAADLEQQLAKIKTPTDSQLLLHCVFTSNSDRLQLMCSVNHFNGDCVNADSWSYPKSPIDKLVNRVDNDVSDHIKTLCKNRMSAGSQGRH